MIQPFQNNVLCLRSRPVVGSSSRTTRGEPSTISSERPSDAVLLTAPDLLPLLHIKPAWVMTNKTVKPETSGALIISTSDRLPGRRESCRFYAEFPEKAGDSAQAGKPYPEKTGIQLLHSNPVKGNLSFILRYSPTIIFSSVDLPHPIVPKCPPFLRAGYRQTYLSRLQVFRLIEKRDCAEMEFPLDILQVR